MWSSNRKGSWPPRENGAAAQAPEPRESAREPGTRRGNGHPGVPSDSYYFEWHESWHRAASPDHVRKNHRSR
jgi:hypothetical protein